MTGIYLTEHRLKVRTPSGERPYIPGLPAIQLSWCNENCGGYRFKTANYAPCRGKETCCYKFRLSRNQLILLAQRYVRQCPVCARWFAGSGGKSAIKVAEWACPDKKCRLAWAERNPSLANTCQVCGKPCLTTFTIEAVIMPKLYPKTLIASGSYCLCNGDCLKKFQAESREDLKSQAKKFIAKGVDLQIKRKLVDV